MKIFVTGTRGIPSIPGGIERHCQEIYPLVAAKGHEVFVAVRKPYVQYAGRQWKGVRLVPLYAPLRSSLETIVHTFLSVLKARLYSPDILHVHAIGAGLMVPLARLMGMRVVLTHHGPDYERKKWGAAARMGLRMGEWLCAKWANEIIAISKHTRAILKVKYNRRSVVIYNGVSIPRKSSQTDYLEHLGVMPGKYILVVSRLEPEKGVHLLIEAFRRLKTDHSLLVVGYANYETGYNHRLATMMAEDSRVIFPGYLTGEPLNQVYSHAGLFVLPSFHEGLPIALLEAMSYGLPVLVSDIPANREVGLAEERYFRCGDVDDLREKLGALLEKPLSVEEVEGFRREIAEKYNWERIARETVGVYEGVLG